MNSRGWGCSLTVQPRAKAQRLLAYRSLVDVKSSLFRLMSMKKAELRKRREGTVHGAALLAGGWVVAILEVASRFVDRGAY